ncbi:BgTH12-04041 [Blumeria graminis f. sp. triticale]|uniref:BgTH12-04041 n=1 Tax=Blumeria graminis f. sp. triticale TaxID=1689686 RepID=A0A9W4CWS3_BLUGR|nr:BgTH12-04041 [Blumeria graminis f. sp. triticale]
MPDYSSVHASMRMIMNSPTSKLSIFSSRFWTVFLVTFVSLI